jgi:hypothetical protein
VPKKTRIHSVICGNLDCRRSLEVSKYSSQPPSDDFPQEQTHEVAYPDASGTRVHCSTCGHYTLFLRPTEMQSKN